MSRERIIPKGLSGKVRVDKLLEAVMQVKPDAIKKAREKNASHKRKSKEK